jgi:hypothetical protein
MTFKMKGFPMHSNKSALKAYQKMGKYSDKDDAVKFGSTEGKSAPGKMKSPMKQPGLYTCQECGATFELPEELAIHYQDAHLSGGEGPSIYDRKWPWGTGGGGGKKKDKTKKTSKIR